MRDFLGFFSFVALILLALFLVWFALRSYGLSQPVSTYQTPLVEDLKKRSSELPLNWGKEDELLQIEFQNGQWHLEKARRSLAKVLTNRNFTQPTLLFFSGKDPKALPSLRKLMKEGDHWKNFVFCSRFDGLLKDLRELEPEWTFCNGEIYMTRFLAFNSLGLESLLQISADIFFIHYVTSISKTELSSIIEEVHRQNKLIFIGPVPRPLEGVKPDGWMVIPEDQKVE